MYKGDPTLGIGIFLVFILINAILYGFGAAIQTVNENVIEERAGEGDKKSQILLKWIDNPMKLINSIHIATIIMNMVAGAYLIQMIVEGVENVFDIGNYIWIYWVIIILLIITLAVFGIFVPKKTATRNPEKFVYTFYGIVILILTIVFPITYVITKISNATIKLYGIAPFDGEDNVTEEEIMTMVNEGHEQGVILASEAEMITNIFEFGEKEAQDIMTHRKNIIAIDGNNTIDETFSIIIYESNSRFPVYDRDIDNIVGVLHFRDLMKIYADCSKREKSLIELKEELLYDAHFIPETRNINALFKAMQSKKIHMAIVIDEYGQTSGIVTMEDILEEIVGNIMDEHDEEEHFITHEADGSYIMDGSTMLDDIEDILDIEFEDKDYDTLNGFMIFYLGKIPEEGESFEIEYCGYVFKIINVESKMIKKVNVKKIENDIV